MEIKIKLNGEERLLDKPLDISSLLLMLELPAENLIVELNRELLHKNKYEQTILVNDDELELIRFVGGG
ncbi:sulfur carrier protein [Desulfosarcina sp. BuS5]|uniref:sulfur carrier protein ThiS n=1 Tax=Desulfosarcina sp. BuS5 TaxID=933262 RepID=UPI000688D7E6|nr:sulfur carrier protein ThiS [Desulfosarcina sp. BuS5]WDN87287.1 sulfur carrier protein [Desulfosarcina sp. BuS5]